jgi:hypothetical protein
MKRNIFLIAVLAIFSFVGMQAQETRPFKGLFQNEESNLRCELNLYEDDIPVPGLELDTCFGYLKGSINGMWVILKVKESSDEKFLVRAASERGGDAQDLEFVAKEDGTLEMKQVDGVTIKGVAKNKYVKLPKIVKLTRLK